MTRTSPPLRTPPALIARVARRFFIDGRSKVEIADELNLSRFKVARLLDEARERGFVKITIGGHGAIDLDLSSRLRDAFRLVHSVVVRDDGLDDRAVRTRLASTVAELLDEVACPRDVLGVAWWHSVVEMGAAVRGPVPCDVVQLTGSVPGAGPGLPDVVRMMARAGRGTAYAYDAPMLVADADGATARRRQLDLARAAQQFGSLTRAVVGISPWRRSDSAAFDALDPADAAAWADAGACAEVAGVVLTPGGLPLRRPGGYSVGVTAGQLRAVPDVIGVAHGDADEVAAVAAALAGGMVTGLVTHQTVASALLHRFAPPRELHASRR